MLIISMIVTLKIYSIIVLLPSLDRHPINVDFHHTRILKHLDTSHTTPEEISRLLQSLLKSKPLPTSFQLPMYKSLTIADACTRLWNSNQRLNNQKSTSSVTTAKNKKDIHFCHIQAEESIAPAFLRVGYTLNSGRTTSLHIPRHARTTPSHT